MDLGGEARFVEEHLDELSFAGQVRVQPLDRDEPLKARDAWEAREVDRGHPAAREFRHELEAIEPFYRRCLEGPQLKFLRCA